MTTFVTLKTRPEVCPACGAEEWRLSGDLPDSNINFSDKNHARFSCGACWVTSDEPRVTLGDVWVLAAGGGCGTVTYAAMARRGVKAEGLEKYSRQAAAEVGTMRRLYQEIGINDAGDVLALYAVLGLDHATATLGDAVKRVKALGEAVDAEKKYIEQLESSEPASLHSVYTVHPREGDVVVFEGEVTEAFMRMTRRYIKEKYGASAVNVPGQEPLAPLLERIAVALERQIVEPGKPMFPPRATPKSLLAYLQKHQPNIDDAWFPREAFGADFDIESPTFDESVGYLLRKRLIKADRGCLRATATGMDKEAVYRAPDSTASEPDLPPLPDRLDAPNALYVREDYDGEMDALRNLAAAVGAWWAHPNRPGALVDGMVRAYRAWDRGQEKEKA